MKTADFDFPLPFELIALRPVEKRDSSRLLVLHRDGSVEHKLFTDIAVYLKRGDMLIANNTRVFPARIFADKHSGGILDILLIKEVEAPFIWEVMFRGNFNGTVSIADGTKAEVITRSIKKDGKRITEKFLKFANVEPQKIRDIIWRCGNMPLPPYIKRLPDSDDKQRYQTIYAEKEGSIAAPTAGLHFTEDLMNILREKEIAVRFITLHVGIGTFKPVKSDTLSGHCMEREYFEIKQDILKEIDIVKRSGGRVITVGTTATRCLEGFLSGMYEPHASSNGCIKGYTDIFIYPGYYFKAADGIITNFHLPRSTPLMLASAFGGFKKIKKAYEEAVAMGYRFFSYGDAMLIL
jgi:S-adenosylmethionine:tRNA ribosyltransferase-isomerase